MKKVKQSECVHLDVFVYLVANTLPESFVFAGHNQNSNNTRVKNEQLSSMRYFLLLRTTLEMKRKLNFTWTGPINADWVRTFFWIYADDEPKWCRSDKNSTLNSVRVANIGRVPAPQESPNESLDMPNSRNCFQNDSKANRCNEGFSPKNIAFSSIRIRIPMKYLSDIFGNFHDRKISVSKSIWMKRKTLFHGFLLFQWYFIS